MNRNRKKKPRAWGRYLRTEARKSRCSVKELKLVLKAVAGILPEIGRRAADDLESMIINGMPGVPSVSRDMVKDWPISEGLKAALLIHGWTDGEYLTQEDDEVMTRILTPEQFTELQGYIATRRAGFHADFGTGPDRNCGRIVHVLRHGEPEGCPVREYMEEAWKRKDNGECKCGWCDGTPKWICTGSFYSPANADGQSYIGEPCCDHEAAERQASSEIHGLPFEKREVE